MFRIDENASDDEMMFIDTNHGTFVLRIEEDGLKCCIFPLTVVDEPVGELKVTHQQINKHVEEYENS